MLNTNEIMIVNVSATLIANATAEYRKSSMSKNHGLDIKCKCTSCQEIERLTAEVDRLRAALQFIATYEGSLDRDAYIRLRNHAADVLRDNQQ